MVNPLKIPLLSTEEQIDLLREVLPRCEERVDPLLTRLPGVLARLGRLLEVEHLAQNRLLEQPVPCAYVPQHML